MNLLACRMFDIISETLYAVFIYRCSKYQHAVAAVLRISTSQEWKEGFFFFPPSAKVT